MKKQFLFLGIFISFCAVVLLLTLRGLAGNPTSQVLNSKQWTDEGPLELSPERGRFALLYSLIEDRSVYFSLPIARLALPDLGYKNGHYVSLFPPGMSFLVIPGYLIGKYLGVSQVGAFAVISLFALLNVILIYAISTRLGAHRIASMVAGLVFLFATPAFAYAVTLYQHHVATCIILSSIWLLMRFRGLKPLPFIWLLMAATITIDYPSLLLMIPIGLTALSRLFAIESKSDSVKIGLRLAGILTFISAVLPLLFFFWFNQTSYGNPLQLSGTVSGVRNIDEGGNPIPPEGVTDPNILAKYKLPDLQNKSAVGFFDPRRILPGLLVHFFSIDRGVLIFAPVLLFSLVGVYMAYRTQLKILSLILGVIGVNIILYSMWGDPWGGWAFGSRYLVPSYALLAVLIALTLTQLRQKVVWLIVFLLLVSYSFAINTLGALTSNKNPPSVEIAALAKVSGRKEEYSYDRNFTYLSNNKSKSFVWQTYLADTLSALQYYQILTICLVVATGGLLWKLSVQKSKGIYES